MPDLHSVRVRVRVKVGVIVWGQSSPWMTFFESIIIIVFHLRRLLDLKK